MFFYKEDIDVTLEAFAQRLSNVVFHDKLGTIAQKVDRMMSIANTKEEHRAVALCKADLTTQMVGEFPELQGVIGEIYALIQEEASEVSFAIGEHYKPVGANDTLPFSRMGARVSFFDKLDTLVGFLGVGIYPTGSKDPFALRRAALCIVRLLCDFKHDILDSETLSWYVETLIVSYSDQGMALDSKTLENVHKFLIDRLKVYLTDKLEVDSSVADSAIASFDSLDFNYKAAIIKIKNLENIRTFSDFSTVLEGFKRAIGILGDDTHNSEKILITNYQFANNYMENLKSRLIEFEENNSEFEKAVKASQAILAACDNIWINDQDPEIRENNIQLFKKFINLIQDSIGNLSGMS
jgi:glycyl-tRNA synthetase beta chain